MRVAEAGWLVRATALESEASLAAELQISGARGQRGGVLRHPAPLLPAGCTASEVVVARVTFLSPPDFHRLDWACRPITSAFGEPPYLVGSVLTRPDFRDIDLRLILDDDVVRRMFGDGAYGVRADGDPEAVRLLLNIALSDLIQKAANPPRPIDFQIQSMSEANVPEHGARNPLGIRR